MLFTVSWTIDLEADSYEDAARKALAIQRDRHSTATVFHVDGIPIDLDEINNKGNSNETVS